MSQAQAIDSSSLCDRFRGHIESTWRRNSISGRHYVDTTALKTWMRRKDTQKAMNHTARLLKEVFQGHGHQPVFENDITRPGRECFCVFSLLCELHLGHLIEYFPSSGITDNSLPTAQHYYQTLKENIKRHTKYNDEEIEQIKKQFDHERWRYCPISIDLTLPYPYLGGHWILPFFRCEPIVQGDGKQKGGTAHSVWQVSVQECRLPTATRESLSQSRYKDKTFGWCYDLAIKTYDHQSVKFFDWETKAFRMLQGQPGMVQYCGQYSDQKHINGRLETFHNIVMEFGEADLDEYFAGNKPPVTADEIFAFWSSLFKVAGALKRLHKLPRILDGNETEYLDGWHADLKPDNILIVNDEYKLADFGFAKFKGQGSEMPLEYLEGGTEAYGAPEQVRATSTRTPVSQRVDIWSFGTVLSIAATWVVLGHDGIQQYERLRSNAISELRVRKAAGQKLSVPKDDHSFHNGKGVLPEVLHWHDYLRKTKRSSDTVTSLVLRLVEEKLLRERPEDRYTSSELCDELEKLLNTARHQYKMQSDNESSREIHPVVLEALLSVEREREEAHTSSGTAKTSLGGSATGEVKSTSAPKRPQKSSLRRGKASKLEGARQYRTAHRTKVLEETLQESHKSGPRAAPESGSIKRGIPPTVTAALTESPQSIQREFLPSHAGPWTSKLVVPNDNMRNEVHQVNDIMSVPLRISSELLPTDRAVDVQPSISSLETLQHPTSSSRKKTVDYPVKVSDHAGPALAISSSSQAMDISNSTERFYSSSHSLHSPYGSNGVSLNAHGVSSPIDSMYKRSPVNGSLDLTASPSSSSDYTIREEYDIFRTHQRLKSKEKQINPFKRLKKDEYLKDFIKERDIIFVIDNGSTMHRAWEAVAFVVETLAMQLRGLDEDGLDVHFAFSAHNNLSNTASVKRIVDAMEKAKPKGADDPEERRRTDISSVLGELFEVYKRRQSQPGKAGKAVTLVVFTDGIWEGTPRESYQALVVERLVEFLRFVKGQLFRGQPSFKDRLFTIQFIRFGSDTEGRKRLKELDDDLSKNNPEIRDVIDAVSWKGKVRKMLAGSLDAYWDGRPGDGSDEEEHAVAGTPHVKQSAEIPLNESESRMPQHTHLGRVSTGHTSPGSSSSHRFSSKIKNLVLGSAR